MKLLYSKEQIDQQISRMATEMTRDFAERRPLIIGVLKGAAPFMVELALKMPIPLQMDFTTVSSYKDGKKSGELKMVMDVNSPVGGRDVVIVDDILDSGNTLKYLKNHYQLLGARNIYMAVLVRRILNQTLERPELRYVGFDYSGEKFLVGFGLDNKDYDRNLPAIYELEEGDLHEK